MRKKVLFLALVAIPVIMGCNSQMPLSPEGTSESVENDSGASYMLQSTWSNQLQQYRQQTIRAFKDIKSGESLSDLYGPGQNSISGDGTFIGEGNGTTKLHGVGIVTGEVAGTVLIKDTDDINVTGLEYTGIYDTFKRYEGNGHFTATSDLAQTIQVNMLGDGWVIGAGTGIACWSGEGWAFWYR